MTQRTEIAVAGEHGVVDSVSGWTTPVEGLVVNRAVLWDSWDPETSNLYTTDDWVITHLRSGLCLPYRFKGEEQVMFAVMQLAGLCDFTGSGDEVLSHKADIIRVLDAVGDRSNYPASDDVRDLAEKLSTDYRNRIDA